MIGLIEKMEDHDYHGEKLKELLQNIATDGQLVKFLTSFHFTDFFF